MKTIIIFGGSSSKNSINFELAKYASKAVLEVDILSVDMSLYMLLPIYSVDYLAEYGTPKSISDLYLKFQSADGFIISLAEHNGSYPAGYKNVIDWLSVQNGKMFNEKPVLLLATSPGQRGGEGVLNQAISYYPHMGAIVSGSFSLPSFNTNFNNGVISDKVLEVELRDEIEIFSKKL